MAQATGSRSQKDNIRPGGAAERRITTDTVHRIPHPRAGGIPRIPPETSACGDAPPAARCIRRTWNPNCRDLICATRCVTRTAQMRFGTRRYPYPTGSAKNYGGGGLLPRASEGGVSALVANARMNCLMNLRGAARIAGSRCRANTHSTARSRADRGLISRRS